MGIFPDGLTKTRNFMQNNHFVRRHLRAGTSERRAWALNTSVTLGDISERDARFVAGQASRPHIACEAFCSNQGCPDALQTTCINSPAIQGGTSAAI
jgi:hypothetical protein